MNNILHNSYTHIFTEDVIIDIFSESMTQYLQKLSEAAEGRYELDEYDKHVITIAMEQYATVNR